MNEIRIVIWGLVHIMICEYRGYESIDVNNKTGMMIRRPFT